MTVKCILLFLFFAPFAEAENKTAGTLPPNSGWGASVHYQGTVTIEGEPDRLKEFRKQVGSDPELTDNTKVYGFTYEKIASGKCEKVPLPSSPNKQPERWRSFGDKENNLGTVFKALQAVAIKNKNKKPEDLIGLLIGGSNTLQLPFDSKVRQNAPTVTYVCKTNPSLKPEISNDVLWGVTTTVKGRRTSAPTPSAATYSYCDPHRGIQYYRMPQGPAGTRNESCEYNSDLLNVAMEAACSTNATQVRVTGAYRTPLRNLQVLGAPASLHIHCRALDFQLIRGNRPVPNQEVLNVLHSFFVGGIFVHYPKTRSHIHIDLGAYRGDR